jgi:signal transduction histidine kinase
MIKPGETEARVLFRIPRESEWDTGLLTGYITGKRPQIPWNKLLGPIRRRERSWGVLALRNRTQEFTAEQRQALFSITQILTDIVQTVDEERVRVVRRRIEQKLADRQDPKDLIYNLIHGLRSLTYYNHSASLLISRGGSDTLEIAAEQIAWTKSKSKRIGLRLDMDEEIRSHLGDGQVRLYEHRKAGWFTADGKAAKVLPKLLGFCATPAGASPPEVAMICAPIATPDGTLGILKISAREAGVLGDYEARLVEEFIPLMSLALQFSVRTEALHERLLQSERKHALANLTRGITHDVNNALGAMLPLVQQMHEEAKSGHIEPETLRQDLEFIEGSIQTCRRIFGGMLAVARGSDRGLGHGNLRRAIDGALSVLEDGLKRRAIKVDLDLPGEIPAIRGTQGDLTQLFLNICTNASDAMPGGGDLNITARPDGDTVEVMIRDTGKGIPPEVVSKVFEPFYSTKQDGSGLGLSICRSILWDVGGEMTIESKEGKGTTLRLQLPVLDEGAKEDRK